jgi:hypothetical protein
MEISERRRASTLPGSATRLPGSATLATLSSGAVTSGGATQADASRRSGREPPPRRAKVAGLGLFADGQHFALPWSSGYVGRMDCRFRHGPASPIIAYLSRGFSIQVISSEPGSLPPRPLPSRRVISLGKIRYSAGCNPSPAEMVLPLHQMPFGIILQGLAGGTTSAARLTAARRTAGHVPPLRAWSAGMSKCCSPSGADWWNSRCSARRIARSPRHGQCFRRRGGSGGERGKRSGTPLHYGADRMSRAHWASTEHEWHLLRLSALILLGLPLCTERRGKWCELDGVVVGIRLAMVRAAFEDDDGDAVGW